MFTHNDRKTMLVNELYTLRSLLSEETLETAKAKLVEIIHLVSDAPVSEKGASLPRINAKRG